MLPIDRSDASGVPVLLSLDAVIAWARPRDEKSISKEDLYTLCTRVGRNNAPEVLYWLHSMDRLSPAAYYATGGLWSIAEFPDRLLQRRDWIELFERAGYCVDELPAERPTEALTLFRGSSFSRRRNWSWTDSREVAERFASGEMWGRPLGQVWTAEVQPWRLLARNGGHDESVGRDESEYVVNTRSLKVTEAT